jgi:PAS domain S-box-containing protein
MTPHPAPTTVPPDHAQHAAELLELGDAFLELDRHWRIVRVNRRLEELSRRPRAEALGRPFAEVWPELAPPRSRLWRELRRSMDERVPAHFHVYSAPLELWAGVTAYPIRTGGIAVFLRDVTAIKQGEHEKARLAAIVESTDDAIISKDLEGTIVTWNVGAERLFGYAAQEVIGRPITILLPPDRLEEEDRILAELRAGRRVDHFETRRLRKDGSAVEVSVTVSPLRGDDGEVIGASKIARDITERTRAELALKRSEEALRASEEKFRDANARLREADRRKDEFLGMLSHELRNPLAPIRNSLFILDRVEPTSPQARRAKDVIGRQVAHLTRLVDDLLDVTRIARGKIELRRADLDLAALARRTADDYWALMNDRGLELVVEMPGDPVVVNGDEVRLAQVLGNLLSNAAKFTPAGGRVTLALRAREGRAAVHVRDTGPGIAPEVLPRIFEAFTQAEQTLARSEGGLGLGLALVRGLAALHGGEVSASSPGPGKGSEFVVTLPLTCGAMELGRPGTAFTLGLPLGGGGSRTG